MIRNYSPLRYPGGKNKLTPFIRLIIQNLQITNGTYIEPFAGGAGVALSLLLDGTVSNIVINDYDKAIYSIWRAIKEEPLTLIQMIKNTPITTEEWQLQKQIYLNEKKYSIELAFAALFLNRTNHSGILDAGPIGGYAQNSKWQLDARFNKVALISRIEEIVKHKSRILVYNKDILSLLQNYIPQFDGNVFIYFDPPYYNNGRRLYKNSLLPSDHRRIRDAIVGTIFPWIVTYDDVDTIREIYSNCEIKKFDLTYSAANKGLASELMVFSDESICPTASQMKECGININLRA